MTLKESLKAIIKKEVGEALDDDVISGIVNMIIFPYSGEEKRGDNNEIR